MRGWRDLAAEAPREATLTAAIGGDEVGLGYVWIGDPAAGRTLLGGLRCIGSPDRVDVQQVSYIALQTREDSNEGHNYRRYWKGHYLSELTNSAIGALLDRDPDDQALPSISLQAYGGAIADVDDNATAFSHRSTRFEYVASAMWSDPNQDSERIAAARHVAAKLEPFAAGAYVNTLSEEDRQEFVAHTRRVSVHVSRRSRTCMTRRTSFI